ncbi:hypothetical protein FKM82_009602 [Ascaphus truei]
MDIYLLLCQPCLRRPIETTDVGDDIVASICDPAGHVCSFFGSFPQETAKNVNSSSEVGESRISYQRKIISKGINVCGTAFIVLVHRGKPFLNQ